METVVLFDPYHSPRLTMHPDEGLCPIQAILHGIGQSNAQ
jgi:hypothetical protein